MKWYRINALLLKYFYITINRFDRLFDIIYWPILDIFIWGFMTIYIQKISDVNLLSFVFGGLILWLFVWRSSQDIAVFVLEDFWSRNLYNMYSSPLMLKEVVISLIIMGVLRSIAAFLFVSSIAYIFYKFSIFSIGITYIGILAFTLLIFSYALGIVIASLIMKYGSRIQIIAWSLVWIMQPFSCVFYPLSALPPWAQFIAKLLPTTYVFENMRSILLGNPLNMLSIVKSIFLAFILFILASWLFYHSVNHAKKTGLLAKNE